MDAVLISPPQVDILAVADDDANCFTVVVVVVVQHIGVRSILLGAKGPGRAAQPYQHNTPLIWSKGLQSQRMVLEEALEHTQLVPLDLIERSQPAQVFIKKAQLLVNDDGFGGRSVLAFANVGKLNHLAGIAANRVQLGVQEVYLVFQSLLYGLHFSHFFLQLGHQTLLFFLQSCHQGVDLSLKNSKLTVFGILDILRLLLQLVNFRFIFFQLFGQPLLGQTALLIGRDNGLSLGPNRHRQHGPELGRGDFG